MKSSTMESNPFPIKIFLVPSPLFESPRCRKNDPQIKARQIHALWSPRQGPWFWRMCRHRRSNVDGTRRVSENGNHMVHTHNDDRTWLNVRQCLKFLNACIPFICPRTHVCTWEMCECGLPLQAALSFPNFFGVSFNKKLKHALHGLA